MNNTTNKAMVHLRLNQNLYKDIKKTAKAMGVSVSLIGETLFKEFLNTKKLTISASYTPSDELKKILDESEKNRDNNKYWTSHNSVKDLMADLKN